MERLSYDAWGKRRNPNGTDDTTNNLQAVNTDHGYTGHEHFDAAGLIHMNGRVYDPRLGRFIEADPYIQAPGNLQSFNRYTYVRNNPFFYTDPSGYLSLSDIDPSKSVKNFVSNLSNQAMNELGANKYVGGLLQMGFLSSPIFGPVYGWSTGDWNSVGRAVATSGVMAASIYAGNLASAAYSQPILYSAQGLAYSGTTLSAAEYVGVNALISFGTSYGAAIANGASSEEAFRGGILAAKRSVLFSLVDIAAINMRADTVTDTLRNPMGNNNGKVSAGYRGDGFGTGGCRWPCSWSPFGGVQGENPGNLMGIEYQPGGIGDFIIEANGGPHDFLSSWQYDALGNTREFFRSGFGSALGWAGSVAMLPLSIPVSALSVAAPYNSVLYSNRYLDY